MQFQRLPEVPCRGDGRLTRERLADRPSREPDLEAENGALWALTEELATRPGNLWQKLVATVLELCRADVAGISLLDEASGTFRWEATAGPFAPQLGSSLPREFIPGDPIIPGDDVLLVTEPWEPDGTRAGRGPVAVETLVCQFRVEGRPVGAVWAILHSRDRRFDAADARLLSHFSRIAAAGYSLKALRRAEETTQDETRPRLEERMAVLEEIFRAAPSFLHVLRGPEFIFEFANEAYYQLVGRRDLLGRPAFEALPEAAGAGYEERIARVLETREPFFGKELPVTLSRTPGSAPEERIIDLVYLPLLDPDGSCTRVLGHGTDVTDYVRARKQAEVALDESEVRQAEGRARERQARQVEGVLREREARQAYLLRLGDALRPLADSAAIQVAAAQVLGEYLQADCVRYGEVEGGSDEAFTVYREYRRAGLPSTVGRQRFDAFGAQATETLRAGRSLVVTDVLAPSEHSAVHREADAAPRSYVVVPLVKEGSLAACLVVTEQVARQWNAHEVELIEETAERTWAAVERSRAEEALRQSEERFRLMADAIPQIVWITDAEGRTEFFNKQWTHYTGVPYEASTAAEIAGGFVHPDDAIRTMDAFTEARRLGRTFEVEHRIRSAEGAYRWFLVRAEPYRDPQTGEILRWFGASTDIHDRKLAEAALRASEARQAFLLQLTDRLRPFADPAVIQYEAACALGEYLGVSRVGYAEDGGDGETIVVTRNYTAGVPGIEGRHRYADYGQGHMRELRAGRTSVRADVANDPSLSEAEKAAFAHLQLGAMVNVPLVKAGRLVAVLFVHHWEARAWSTDELALLEETAERTWAAVERARAEEAQRQAVERYEQQVRLFEGVASTTPDFVYLFDLQGQFRYANRRLLEVWGMSLPEVVGKTCRELGYEQWHHDMHMREIAQVIKTKQPIKGEVPFKAPLTGVFGVYEYIFTPVIGPDGEVELIAGTTRDITERKQAADALQESARRKDEFLATLAHELRNPLAPILTASEVLRLRANDPAAVERARETIRRQAEHMRHLIDDLLDVARITRGMVELQLEPIDLGSVLTGAVQMVRPLIDRRGQSLHVSVPLVPVRLPGDLHRLIQVVTNLLNNAAKFTPPGGRISVTAEHRGAEVVIRVQDSGKGIPSEMLPYVFDLFTQVNPSIDRAEGGLGLGLTLVQKLVEMHGGRVEAHSAGVGQGSEFVVRLPAQPAVPEKGRGDTPAPSAPASQPRRVTVVDDNVDAADTLAELMPIWGHDVRVAYTGPEALALTREYRPDVVLLDIGLPGMDGYSVAQQIRNDPALDGVRLIAVTGFGQEEDRQRAREAGFDEHLTKPVDPDLLRRVLEAQ